MDERWIPTEKVARMLGCSQSYVWVLLHRGELDGKKVGRRWYIAPESVEQLKQKMTPPEGWLTLREASSRFGIAYQRLRRLIKWGGVTAKRVGRSIYVEPGSLAAYRYRIVQRLLKRYPFLADWGLEPKEEKTSGSEPA